MTESGKGVRQLSFGPAEVRTVEPTQPPSARGSRSKTRGSTSKYDFVKVRVWLEEHYYVLSRFLISRMLTVTKVAFEDAVNASLELKKLLVDAGRLDIPQDEMEHLLFAIVRKMGYGEKIVDRYRMIMRFHQQRVPLIVLISGTGCIGKSMLATRLAERLNITAVLPTDLVHELMVPVCPDLNAKPIWSRPFVSAADTVAEFRRESLALRQGLEGDLEKAFKDGKPIIIEGQHLDLALFRDVLDASRRTSMAASGEPGAPLDLPEVEAASFADDDIRAAPAAAPLPAPAPSPYRAKRRLHAVVVPFLLTVSERDHRCLIETWLHALPAEARAPLGPTLPEQVSALHAHYSAIEQHLLRCGVPPTRIDVHASEAALDALHRTVIERISACMRAVEQ